MHRIQYFPARTALARIPGRSMIRRCLRRNPPPRPLRVGCTSAFPKARARANRGGERPRSGTNAAKRDATRSDRTRTQSHDCGEMRRRKRSFRREATSGAKCPKGPQGAACGRVAGRPLREGKHGWAVLRHTLTGTPHTALTTPHTSHVPHTIPSDTKPTAHITKSGTRMRSAAIRWQDGRQVPEREARRQASCRPPTRPPPPNVRPPQGMHPPHP